MELRRGVLAVCVLHDLDIVPGKNGLTLPGSPEVYVSWSECKRALVGWHPESNEGHRRLARWLLTRRWAADLPKAELRSRIRPMGLPLEHDLHPGLDWVMRRVLGDALDLGLGAVGLAPHDPDAVVPLPAPLLDDLGLDAEVEWLEAEAYLGRMGSLAAARLARSTVGVLRPMGDCDVVTLLGSWALRGSIADRVGGMGAVVVPMRSRGWTDLALIDPAFGPAAAAATDPIERGFPRPLLVTADELTLAPEGGRPELLALREGAEEPWLKDVLYR